MEQSLIISLSDADKQWLNDNVPSLRRTQEGKAIVLEGLLGFDLYYDTETQKLLYNPPAKYHSSKFRIKDIYKVQIKFVQNAKSVLPEVREVGGELEKFARKSGIPLIDLHVQPNGTLCTCPRQEEKKKMPDGLNLDILFNELIIPFFYSHSFFKKYREKPWKDYSHGTLGTLEHFARSNIENDESFVTATLEAMEEDQVLAEYYSMCLRGIIKFRKAWCPCGVKGKFRDCHKEAFQGLEKLKAEAERFQIDLI